MSKTPHFSHQNISVSAGAAPLLTALIANAESLQLSVFKDETGATIIDAGIQTVGCAQAGQQIAEICMGGLGQVKLVQNMPFATWKNGVEVSSSSPVLACLASQYAGWSLSHEKFFALASGPARAIAQREAIFKELAYVDQAEQGILVMETAKIPPAEVIAKVARDTGLPASQLIFILTPTSSVAGVTQIAARVLEVALHKAHTLKIDLNHILAGSGRAPVPPVSADFVTGMGRTNDAILYGGEVSLTVDMADEAAAQLARALPSDTSPAYGEPFAALFKAVNGDFYQIDPLLFSPALVRITNQRTQQVFVGGKLNEAILNQSFS